MPKNPPEDMPRITASIYYEDVAAALDWLAKAFGFRERMRMPGLDGSIMHAEMELADGVIMLGRPNEAYRNPKRLGGVTQSLYVYVDDVDDHFRRARAAGATITQEPKDEFWGDRQYGAEDPEGHHWYFAQHVRDVSPEELEEAMKQPA
jgi:uncharacterized glyoxalase superfamily protein PhnB